MSGFNKYLCITLATVSLLNSAPFFAAIPATATQILIKSALTTKTISEDLRYLTTVIGGRPTGSAAFDSALQWSLQRFKEAGITNAYHDAYTAPLNWLPNIALGEMRLSNPVSSPQALRLAALPFSISTPDNGLEAPIYALSSTNTEEILEHANQIKGHWLLVKTDPMQNVEGLFKEYLLKPDI